MSCDFMFLIIQARFFAWSERDQLVKWQRAKSFGQNAYFSLVLSKTMGIERIF
jgi:hypothetical protein